jgi:hypothetical protein
MGQIAPRGGLVGDGVYSPRPLIVRSTKRPRRLPYERELNRHHLHKQRNRQDDSEFNRRLCLTRTNQSPPERHDSAA